MAQGEAPELPAAPVTPVLPAADAVTINADDESPTQELWRGAAAVPATVARRRFSWSRGRSRETSDTLDRHKISGLGPGVP